MKIKRQSLCLVFETFIPSKNGETHTKSYHETGFSRGAKSIECVYIMKGDV